jgi:sterol-4alpha-carboxylate 3-dehydrogenase (decarboxylating)
VVYEGKDQRGVDETTPIPISGLDSYTQTKALAEKLVLEASGQGGMLTAAIRPHGIFGPGVRFDMGDKVMSMIVMLTIHLSAYIQPTIQDRQFFPVLVANARKGKSKYALGDGKNVADFTYVGNVAHAHLLAAEKVGIWGLWEGGGELWSFK